MKTIAYILASTLLLQCGRAQTSHISPEIQKKWETSSLFQVPESVKFDAERNQIYVSNINGDPSLADGNGFISRISPDGRILDLHWIDGLNAPKGMGIVGNHLFVTDLTDLVEIDIPSSRIISKIQVEGAKFLNDIDVDEDGRVYISDMKGNKIYRYASGKIRPWLESEQLKGCNGLYCEGNYLYIGTANSILKTDLKTTETTTFLSNTGSIDGLEMAGPGVFLYSDWNGSVYKSAPASKTKAVKLLDTSAGKINAADIEYVPELKMILVPTFFDNRIMAYTLQ